MFNRMRSNAVPEAGVVIASGGNAGIAVAVAAKALGVRCEVFVPETSSAAKRAKLAELGAVLTVTGASYADALAASLARQARDRRAADARLRPARSRGRRRHARRGSGRGSRRARPGAGERRRRRADRRHRRRGSRTDAGSMRWSPSWRRPCTGRGRPASRWTWQSSGIAADSLGARRIGAIAWEVTRAPCGRRATCLRDAAIRAAQRDLWTKLRLAVEPAAALPLAALTTRDRVPRQDETVLLVICGANLDLASLDA